MIKESFLKVWIADHSQNDAERLASALRNAGYRIRTTLLGSRGELQDKLERDTPDLLLCSDDLVELLLTDCVELCQNAPTPVPIIGVSERPEANALSEALRAGVRDLVQRDAEDHLEQVVARELEVGRQRAALTEKRAEAAESRALADTFLDSSSDGVAYIKEGIHGQVNSAYARRFGFELPAEVEGLPMLELVAPDDREPVKARLRDFDKGHVDPAPLTVTMQTLDGETFKVSVLMQEVQHDGERTLRLLVPIETGNPELEAIHAALQKEFKSQRNRLKDLERQHQALGGEHTRVRDSLQAMEKEAEKLRQKLASAERQLAEQAEAAAQQPAGGGYNREMFVDALQERLSKHPPRDARGGLVCFSVDQARELLERVGFANLASFLREVDEILTGQAREEDICHRIGDTLFAVYLSRATHDEIDAWARQTLDAIKAHVFESGSHSSSLTCSAGVREITATEEDIEGALQEAWRGAMAAAEGGGGQVKRVEKDRPDEGEGSDTQWQQLLKNALKNDRFQLVYQPIAALDGSSTERYDVRIRMVDEEGTEYKPHEFIPAAERTGMMIAVDRWVIDKTLTVAQERGAEARNASFFVKLSAASVADAKLAGWIESTLRDIPGIQAEILFEVSKGVAESHLREAQALSQALNKLKCGFAIDNFGIDQGSMNILEHLPLDFIKLEGSFMDDLRENPDKREQVQDMITTAQKKGIKTIAGHVEDANSLATLWQLGVNFIQGNYVQEPEVVLASGGGFQWNGEDKEQAQK